MIFNILIFILIECFIRLIGSNKVDGEHDEYLQFDTTSAHKDVAQTTVPFLDAQPVTLSPSTWLSGAGIYHKVRLPAGRHVGTFLHTCFKNPGKIMIDIENFFPIRNF